LNLRDHVNANEQDVQGSIFISWSIKPENISYEISMRRPNRRLKIPVAQELNIGSDLTRRFFGNIESDQQKRGKAV
jgi:hypothetical protein